ncbi:competence type IV pilus major pilin ComGC [Enterococcus sp. JM9B]|uniref:competence type IV pilus major pilin ComGC n=1 Tax=Enterococcus sp. JM9B TaxID=1857216 RepID=UPI001374F9AA|nr:competence type IV pilus major pilin ComGC [Enterococcus sp. JM9B]
MKTWQWTFKKQSSFNKKKGRYSGFTLIEMLIVLLIISVLVLLFVPNLAKHQKVANKESERAVIQVVETQMELYQIEFPDKSKPTVEELEKERYITSEQLVKYNIAKEKQYD